MQVIEWTFSLAIPAYENVHQVLHAFFRTSEHGEWHPDDTAESDAFVLSYIRGNWSKSLFGLGKRLLPTSYELTDSTQVPLRLTVTIRPSRNDANIGLRYRFHWDRPVMSHGRIEQTIANYVLGEMRSLARYLKDCYELPALPEIRNQA